MRPSPDVYLAPHLPSGSEGRLFLVGERSFAFRTRKGGATRDRYVADDLAAGLDLPVRLGRPTGFLQTRLRGSWLDGRLNRGELPSRIGAFEATLARPLSSRWSAALSARRRDADASYESDVLRSTFEGFGPNPDIDLSLRETSIGIGGRYAGRRTAVDLGLGATVFAGDASAVGNERRLALPLDMAGRELSLALDRALTDSTTLGFHLNARNLEGSDPVRREGGRTVGEGRARLRNLTASLTLDRRLGNGGRLLAGIEHAETRFRAAGRVPDADDAAIDAPAGASVRYRAGANVDLSQAAFRWESPQLRGRLTLGYRQALVRADASVGYDVRLLLFGAGGEAAARLRPTHAGVLDVAYERTVRGIDAKLFLKQIVPYATVRAGRGGSGGGGGGGPASRSDGGWSVAFLVGRRF